MGHLIQWDNPDKTVLLQTYTAPYNIHDLYAMATESADIINTVPYQVHIIIDERDVNRTFSSKDMLFLEKIMPKNQGSVVMVINKSDYIYRNLLQTLGQALAPNAFRSPHYFNTLDQARQYLKDIFKVEYPAAE